ncbi:MAG: aminoacyl-tRNA hydrolase [Cellulosilyticaceae bacterium]
MKLIIGLGNPGMQYNLTRHNIGFEVLDYIANYNNIDITKNKFKSLIGEGVIKGEKVVLMKPQTYMNLSGEAMSACCNWYKIKPSDILIVYDDVTLEVGQLRIRKTGSAGGHNGIKSIIQHLGGDTFNRIKVGVGEKPNGWQLADYVLGKFSEEDIQSLKERLEDINDAVTMIVEQDVDKAMNKYNGKMRR